jgi:hypothetical protein
MVAGLGPRLGVSRALNYRLDHRGCKICMCSTPLARRSDLGEGGTHRLASGEFRWAVRLWLWGSKRAYLEFSPAEGYLPHFQQLVERLIFADG